MSGEARTDKTGKANAEELQEEENFSDAQLEDVSAGGGGGIYNSGTLTISNSTISGNQAATSPTREEEDSAALLRDTRPD